MANKALLIGINDYLPEGNGGPDLRGCVNDVRDLAQTLSSLSIVPSRPGSMRILTDERATGTAILDGIAWLLNGAKPGDSLVFHYSGHGSQLPDLNENGEMDGKDETLCPHDFASGGMLKDDDLRKAFKSLARGVNLDVILDACHSGTGTREGAAAFRKDRYNGSRYAPPPLDVGFFLEAHPEAPVRKLLAAPGGMREIVGAGGMRHVLWAGCRDDQISAEEIIGGEWRGVFTYCFCRALRRAGAGVTRSELDALVSADIQSMGYSQVPQLEGDPESLAEKVFT